MTTCACAFTSNHPPHTADYHRDHRRHHLAQFPLSTAGTIASLDYLIKLAESERIRAPKIRGIGGVL